jgi:HlyD family secretion protein
VSRVLWALLLLAAVAAVLWILWPAPVAVDVAAVVRGPVRAFVEEEGETRVLDRFVVAAPVAGRLLRVRLDEGDRVEEGAVVATIDPLQAGSRVEEAEASLRALHRRIEGVDRKRPKPEELERARLRDKAATEAVAVAARELEEQEARLERAAKDLVRVRDLVGKSTSTEAELDAAVSEERQSRARVEAARLGGDVRAIEAEVARLDVRILEAERGDYDWEEAEAREQARALEARLAALRDDARRTEIVAPAAGHVLRVFEESERFVAAGTPVVELGDVGRIDVEADFLSEDVAHMREGMDAEVFGRALGEAVLAAKVTRIEPAAFTKVSSLGVEQQRVNVILGFEAPAPPLGDRHRVEVRVLLDRREDAVLVPEGALFRNGGGWGAFRVSEGRAVRTAVRTGLRDGRVREVLEGLAPGDEVVLHPDAALEDGARVRRLP